MFHNCKSRRIENKKHFPILCNKLIKNEEISLNIEKMTEKYNLLEEKIIIKAMDREREKILSGLSKVLKKNDLLYMKSDVTFASLKISSYEIKIRPIKISFNNLPNKIIYFETNSHSIIFNEERKINPKLFTSQNDRFDKILDKIPSKCSFVITDILIYSRNVIKNKKYILIRPLGISSPEGPYLYICDRSRITGEPCHEFIIDSKVNYKQIIKLKTLSFKPFK